MFEVLRDCGALQRILPELDVLWGVPQPVKYHPEIDTGVHIMLVIDYAAKQGYELPVRFKEPHSQKKQSVSRNRFESINFRSSG